VSVRVWCDKLLRISIVARSLSKGTRLAQLLGSLGLSSHSSCRFARQALQAMPSVSDVILESSGCAHTVRAGVPAHARDKDTRALASGLAKRWGPATSPPKPSAAGVNGQANGNGSAMGSAAYVPDVPRSAEVIAAEQAAEEVTHAGIDPDRPCACTFTCAILTVQQTCDNQDATGKFLKEVHHRPNEVN